MTLLVEIRDRMEARAGELDELIGKSERSEDEERRADALIAELNELGPKLKREVDLEAQSRAARDQTGALGTRPLPTQAMNGTHPAALDTRYDPRQSEQRDWRPIGDQFAGSKELDEYRARPNGKSAPFVVGSFFRTRNVPGSPETRNLITDTGLVSPDRRLPGISGPDPLVSNPLRSVLNVTTTDGAAVSFLQQASHTNNAAAVAEAATTSGTGLTGGVKPEAATTWAEVVVPVTTIAEWQPITRQALDDNGSVRGYLEGLLLSDLVEEETDQVLAGNGTAPNMSGILDQTGILTLDTTYWTANPVPGTGTSAANFNRINAAKAAIYASSRSRASFVALNPADWVEFSGAVMETGAFYGMGPYGAADPARMWGLTVIEANAITAGTALVGAGRQATIHDRQAAQILVADQHSDFFIRNIFVFLAEERLALTVHQTNAFALVTLA